MADFTASSSPADKAIVSAATESLSGIADDGFEDACSICLEPFGPQDPSTITSCNHEYHLHCILEWSQRSKECPICWQLFNLKDPAAQELLTGVKMERRSRRKDPSPTTSRFREETMEGDGFFSPDADSDSDSDDRIMLHLAAMLSRTEYNRSMENQSLSRRGPSPVHAHASRADISGRGVIGPSNGASTSSGSTSKANNDGELPSEPRVLSGQTISDGLGRATSSELFSFPKIKSKWSSTSARYKESISRSTLEIKEKLLSHSSVNELSRGVKREMLAGISSIGRMIERLDLTPRSDGPSSIDSCSTSVTWKGKNVQERLDANDSVSRATQVGSTSFLDDSKVESKHL